MQNRKSVFFDTKDEIRRDVLKSLFGQNDEFELIPSLDDSQPPSVILMDVVVAKVLEPTALRAIHNRFQFAPLIVIVDDSTMAKTVNEFESFADDVVREPFKFVDLISMMRLQVRNRQWLTSEPAEFGGLTFIPVERIVKNQEGKEVILSTLESRLLHHLFRSCGKPVGRDSLLKEVWGYAPSVDTTTVQAHVHRIRQKLRILCAQGDLVFTEGDGYGLMVDLPIE